MQAGLLQEASSTWAPGQMGLGEAFQVWLLDRRRYGKGEVLTVEAKLGMSLARALGIHKILQAR